MVAEPIRDLMVEPNGPPAIVDLSKVFTDPDDDDAAIEKHLAANSNTDLVTPVILGDQLTLVFTPNLEGQAEIVVCAPSGKQLVGHGVRPLYLGEACLAVVPVPAGNSSNALAVETLPEAGEPLKVTEASSGFEALRLLPRQSYDLIVTDINMPDINGLELVSFVKGNQAYCSIPLIIISTESSDRDREKGLSLGADAYLVKPFEPDDFLQLARDLLPSPQQEG